MTTKKFEDPVSRLDGENWETFPGAFGHALDRLTECPYESMESLDELVQRLPPIAARQAQWILDQMWASGIEKHGTIAPSCVLGDFKLKLLLIVYDAMDGKYGFVEG